VTVCDQGPGVAEHDRAHLFKPFFQGSRQPPSAAPGNGLGLAIAQEYAQLHGGGVRLCDTPGQAGACFCVHLPFDISLQPGSTTASTSMTHQPSVQDDDPGWQQTQPCQHP